jgi:hypothetical protein
LYFDTKKQGSGKKNLVSTPNNLVEMRKHMCENFALSGDVKTSKTEPIYVNLSNIYMYTGNKEVRKCIDMN